MRKALITVAAWSLLAGSVTAQEQERPRKVLVILAHPDDELPIAPALAMEARGGAQVRIAYATRGEAGPGVSGMAKGEGLGRTRMLEALCASGSLGLELPDIMNFGDGRLTDRPQDKGSPALLLKQDVERIIAAGKPDLVITWGPDGGYGHGDHRMVGAIVTEVVQAMPAAQRPELLYPGIPLGNIPAMPELKGWAETDPTLLTVSYTYGADDLTRATAATQCHKTQFDEASRAGLVPLFDQAVWRGAVHFRKAF